LVLKEMLGGELWWNPNFVVYGADGVPMFPQELLGWNYGRIFKMVGRLFQATPNSKWGMDQD